MIENETIQCPLKPNDYASSQEVKWCPGCGDYAILNAVKKALSELGLTKEETVFISGIGCSSRFPYYMDTYGFHSIHGRAAAVATGTKMANPDLSVWIISGDGDSLAIGGNHFIHAVRRNLNMNLILFNNEIYGLTKGQYSPTSEKGKVTKSSPHGTIENPFSPGELVLGSRGNFFARIPDTNVKLGVEVFKEAERHQGLSVVEVLQNCVIFNDNTHEQITAKELRDDNQLILEHGKPMIYGTERNKGIRLSGLELEVVTIGENGVKEEDILVHDAHCESPILHNMLIRMSLPEFPVAMGVIRDVEAAVYEDIYRAQVESEKVNNKLNSLDDLFKSGNTFNVK